MHSFEIMSDNSNTQNQRWSNKIFQKGTIITITTTNTATATAAHVPDSDNLYHIYNSKYEIKSGFAGIQSMTICERVSTS